MGSFAPSSPNIPRAIELGVYRFMITSAVFRYPLFESLSEVSIGEVYMLV